MLTKPPGGEWGLLEERVACEASSQRLGVPAAGLAPANLIPVWHTHLLLLAAHKHFPFWEGSTAAESPLTDLCFCAVLSVKLAPHPSGRSARPSAPYSGG